MVLKIVQKCGYLLETNSAMKIPVQFDSKTSF